MTSQEEQSGDKSFKIRRGKVDSLSLYEITEHELATLETGSPASLLLNLGLALLSFGTSFLIALVTVSIESERTFIVFVVCTVVGGIGGSVLMILWWRFRQSASAVIARIRSRIQDEGCAQQTESEGATNGA